jgi:hypothetical protein
MEELCAQVLKELKLGKQAFLRSSRQKSSQTLAHTRSSPPNFLFVIFLIQISQGHDEFSDAASGEPLG